MNVSFGARLRAQRERHGVTLATIAEQTKIRMPLLEALERDDVSAWPNGVFRRSYLRAYAQAIGLDPDATFREFQTVHPDPLEEPPEVLAAALASHVGRRPRTRLQFLLDSAFVGLPQSIFRSRGKSGPPPVPPADPSPSEEYAPEPPVEAVVERQQLCSTIQDEPPAEANDAEPVITDADPLVSDPNPVSDHADLVTEDANPLTDGTIVVAPPEASVDLAELARLCTALALARAPGDLERALADAAPLLNASGIVLWLWSAPHAVLWPAVGHGYPREMLAQLPTVRSDADNAIGAAFRSAAPQVVSGTAKASSAVVVPLMSPSGCAGVLALECGSGAERCTAIQAAATILAAQLSMLVPPPALPRTAIA